VAGEAFPENIRFDGVFQLLLRRSEMLSSAHFPYLFLFLTFLPNGIDEKILLLELCGQGQGN
jgi:hypothetical protein